MVVRTMPDALLVARGKGDRSNGGWVNADNMVRAKVAQGRRMFRLMQDMKAERRGHRAHLREVVKKLEGKYHRYSDTFIKQTAASLAAYAARRNVAEIVYDDSQRVYLPTFE